jgi:hypothetical protein
MALRYCGDLIIRIRWIDTAGAYSAVVRNTRGQMVGRAMVSPPAHTLRAVDCPAAYDDAAHAALSFVAEPHGGDLPEANTNFDGCGWFLTRSKAGAK